jgi:hypothetical protein
MFFWGFFLQFNDKKKGWQIQQRVFEKKKKKKKNIFHILIDLDNVFL